MIELSVEWQYMDNEYRPSSFCVVQSWLFSNIKIQIHALNKREEKPYYIWESDNIIWNKTQLFLYHFHRAKQNTVKTINK